MKAQPSRVVVFEPSPIYTVTVEREVGRKPEVHFHLGGQGAWIGRMIALLGAEVVMCGPLGGESGAVLRALAQDEKTGIRLKSVHCSQANGGYIHDRRNGHREPVVEIPSPALTRHEADDLYNTLLEEASHAQVIVQTGVKDEQVIPRSLHQRLPKDATALGCKLVADLDPRTLRRFEGPIEVAKITDVDLVSEGEEATRTRLMRGGAELRERGVRNVVISRGHEPVLACLEGEWLEVEPPKVQAVETRGGGDSMTGALAYAVASEVELLDGLRLAAAAGATNVTRHGLGSGLRATIEALASRVELRSVRGP